MSRVLTTLSALLATAALAAAAATATEAAAPDLGPALARALRAPGVDARRTAALAIDLRTGEVVFRSNPGLALAPASAEKLAVSFVGLRLLGPGYRFRTEVAGAGELAGRTWRGDLLLVGGGDPTLARADLDALARAVAGWGVRRVTGSVLGDETHFDARRDAPGWKPGFLGLESRPLSALSVAGRLEGRRIGRGGGANSSCRPRAAGIAVGGAPPGARTSASRLDLSEPLPRSSHARSAVSRVGMLLKEVRPYRRTRARLRQGRSSALALGIGPRSAHHRRLGAVGSTASPRKPSWRSAGPPDPGCGTFVTRSPSRISGTLKRARLRLQAVIAAGTTSRASALAVRCGAITCSPSSKRLAGAMLVRAAAGPVRDDLARR
jgi:hypothetical protein